MNTYEGYASITINVPCQIRASSLEEAEKIAERGFNGMIAGEIEVDTSDMNDVVDLNIYDALELAKQP